MKKFLSFLLVSILAFPMPSHGQRMIRVSGTVTDSVDGKALQYADVLARNREEKVLTYCVSDSLGHFSMDVQPDSLSSIAVRMLGYVDYDRDLGIIGMTDMYEIGNIAMERASESIEGASVYGEKSRIVYKLDRRSISSTASAASSGGTAADIVSGLPSVLVDSEGEVTFRGSSNFLVYVDGRLSPLQGSAALQQIPAGEVEDVEILTTPSARYKTDGDAAIINIKTRSGWGSGWSGLVNLTGSTLGTWGADAVVNYRKGRHNWYFGGTAQDIKGKSDFNQQKSTAVLGISTVSESDGERWRSYGTKTARAGWSYDDGVSHSLSLDLTGGQTSNWRGGDMRYDETRADEKSGETRHAVYESHDRYNLCKNYFQSSLGYVWKISPLDELSASSRFRYDWYSIEYTESNMFDSSGQRYEGTRGYEEEHHWDCDGALTYRRRLNGEGRLEFGYQYTTYSEHGGYRIKYWDREAQDFIWQEDLATPFYYRRQVHSGYAMLEDKWDRLSLDAGLRADRVLDFTDIGIEGTSRDIKRFDVFPSFHLGYDAPKAGTFTLGYSYRTNRPGIWNLEPYITYEDYYTKKIGNPDIRPEYIHSGELGWHKVIPGGHNLAVTAFCKYRTDIADWVRMPYEPGVTLDMIVNAGNQLETGAEFEGTFNFFKWWKSTFNVSVFNYDFKAVDKACTDARGITFMGNWINAFYLAKGTRIQFDSHYVGPRILSQGSEDAYCFFELAVRQQLLKDRMTLSLAAHDVFRTARYRNVRATSGLESTTVVLPKYPGIVLSLSYNFNSSSHKAASQGEHVLFEGKDF